MMMIDVMKNHFDFMDKVVLVIGSGAGDSSIQFSTISKHIIGLEIENNMRTIAERKLKELKIPNVSFRKGTAFDIISPNQSVDATIVITLPLFIEDEIGVYVREAIRVTKSGGVVINLRIAPLSNGGDLSEIILGKSKIAEVNTEGVFDRIF